MLEEFKKFILKGNVVELAVGVVVGVAFGAVVTAMVKDLITPLIGAIGGQPDFSRLAFTINHSKFLYGEFINAVISFLTIAAVIFFLVLQPLNHLQERASRRKSPADPTEKKCLECLSTIPVDATRCKFCTSKV